MARHASFQPVVDSRTHTLILGSLPGAASLQAGRYYAHPRNQFWRLVGSVFDLQLEHLGYEARLAALLENGIGLWDVIADAERDGSLDAAIRNHRAHDLQSLVHQLPNLRTLGFNGGTAARIGRRELETATDRFRFVTLPSSSAAHAVPFRDKLERWHDLRPQKSTNDSAGPPSVM